MLCYETLFCRCRGVHYLHFLLQTFELWTVIKLYIKKLYIMQWSFSLGEQVSTCILFECATFIFYLGDFQDKDSYPIPEQNLNERPVHLFESNISMLLPPLPLSVLVSLSLLPAAHTKKSRGLRKWMHVKVCEYLCIHLWVSLSVYVSIYECVWLSLIVCEFLWVLLNDIWFSYLYLI